MIFSKNNKSSAQSLHVFRRARTLRDAVPVTIDGAVISQSSSALPHDVGCRGAAQRHEAQHGASHVHHSQ